MGVVLASIAGTVLVPVAPTGAVHAVDEKSRRFLGLKKLTLNNLVQDPSGVRESLARRSGRLVVQWTKPAIDGGADVERYLIQGRRGTGSWQTLGVAIGAQRTLGLTVPTGRLSVRVAAVNRLGRGPYTSPRAVR